MKERTRKMAIYSVCALFIVFLTMMSVSATVVAAAPVKDSFEAIMWGGLATPERSWIDEYGILHIRNMVIEYTGIPGPGGLPYWYPGSITDMSFNIIGTGKMTMNCDIDLYSDQPTGDGRMTMKCEVTLYGDYYVMRASGPIDGLEFSIPFVFIGAEGCIRGTASGVMGYPAVILSGTWIR